jgi:hypothetical protein
MKGRERSLSETNVLQERQGVDGLSSNEGTNGGCDVDRSSARGEARYQASIDDAEERASESDERV